LVVDDDIQPNGLGPIDRLIEEAQEQGIKTILGRGPRHRVQLIGKRTKSKPSRLRSSKSRLENRENWICRGDGASNQEVRLTPREKGHGGGLTEESTDHAGKAAKTAMARMAPLAAIAGRERLVSIVFIAPPKGTR
jgi:hypothetical protein